MTTKSKDSDKKKWWKATGLPAVIYGIFMMVIAVILGVFVGETMTVRLVFFTGIFVIIMGWFLHSIEEMVA